VNPGSTMAATARAGSAAPIANNTNKVGLTTAGMKRTR
jgi:hypothetical protein